MSSPLDPSRYGPRLEPLLAERRQPLDAGEPSPNVADLLTLDQLFDRAEVADPEMARCCLAALWLLHNDLDASHTLSQGIDTPEGSFWHGVMHRREGDFGNAKYWFRRAGDHPVFSTLAERFGVWDPMVMVDRCEEALRTGQDHEACLDAQHAEWETLFDWCYTHRV